MGHVQDEADVSHAGSVTILIGDWRAGQPKAANKLWERYFTEVVRLARRRLDRMPRAVADEEDWAASVLETILVERGEGTSPTVARKIDEMIHRGDLKQVFVMLTAEKIKAMIDRHFSQRQGGGKVSGGEDLDQGCPLQARWEPSPEVAAIVAEEIERSLKLLGDETLRTIAERTWDGFTTQEIAAELKVVPETIQRKLNLIRAKWRKGLP